MTQLTTAERRAQGKAVREQAPLESHAEIGPDTGRDPVGLIIGQAATRVPELVPIRHGRMLVTPFTFYRGAALPMAADLSTVPSSGLRVQLCGDAHLSNFGVFGAPDRRLVFDLNDFDETLPGPFEWDVKRFAASLAVAGRDVGLDAKDRKTLLLAGARAYRESMAEFAEKKMLEVWYARLDVEEGLEILRARSAGGPAPFPSGVTKARGRDRLRAQEADDGRRRPSADRRRPAAGGAGRELLDPRRRRDHRADAGPAHHVPPHPQADRRHLLGAVPARRGRAQGRRGRQRRHPRVGAAARGRRRGGALVLQAKEAQRSVLGEYAGAGKYRNEGQRVVAGQRLMQAASDVFLGWQRATGVDGVTRDYYVRQLRDWKASARVDEMVPVGMARYAELCGWSLARAHARSGDRVAIGAYLGKTDKFDRAMAKFAERYADRTEQDHSALAAAVTDGRIEAVTGL